MNFSSLTMFSLGVAVLMLHALFAPEVGGVIVKVKQGLVAGGVETLPNGKIINKFLGIPFAMPPVGKRRFKDPEPIKPWDGVWNATDVKGHLYKCLQFFHAPGGPYKTRGHEDCLYLNIWTPKVPQPGDSGKLLDVIVYIHGGAFMFGTGSLYEAHGLLENHDIVIVTINYRLGPLGFLSTGDNVVPGNMGLKDQTEALRWIASNIYRFGGSPQSITIAGMSAGGASVHFQMMAPSARGLFHKAISMSGTGLCPWTIAENLPEKTKTIAHHLGCPVNDSLNMVECLRKRPASFIVDASRLYQPFMYNPFSPWAPTVDSFAKNPVLADYPANLIRQGKIVDVPWLESVTTDEGLYPGAEFLVSAEAMNAIDTNWTDLAPHILDFQWTVPESLQAKTAEEIRTKYMGDKPFIKSNFQPFIKIISDRMFIVDAERAARLQAEVTESPIYFYDFNFRGTNSLTNHYGRTKENFGVSHADDTQYLMKRWGSAAEEKVSENEIKMIDFLSTLWTTFAKTGKTHLQNWKPVTSSSFNYLKINSADDLKMIENAPEIGSRSFWDSLPFDEKNIWKPTTSTRNPKGEL